MHCEGLAAWLTDQLHRLGRDYPEPGFHFIPKLQSMFRKFANLTDDAEVESKLKLAEYIKKGAWRGLDGCRADADAETESACCGSRTWLTLQRYTR